MIKINDIGVKKVLVNGNRTHEVKVDGRVVFSDTCTVNWSVVHTYTSESLFSNWSSKLTVSVNRSDSFPVTTKVKVTSIRSDNGNTAINNYDTPLSNTEIIFGGIYWRGLAPFDGYDKVSIEINGSVVHTYQYTQEINLNYTSSDSGSLTYYES